MKIASELNNFDLLNVYVASPHGTCLNTYYIAASDWGSWQWNREDPEEYEPVVDEQVQQLKEHSGRNVHLWKVAVGTSVR